ncbi:MAG: M61 family metallopeptidase [Coleofasciculaceae cyanobacterium SM2_1_6]|nr:M61 family metallopeptidase [Coleofasciculaceae cyanobacterium SM2_1_6]
MIETSATAPIPAKPRSTQLSLAYAVAMPHPESHLFVVTLQIQGWTEPTLDLKMPVWTPGSYLVREYARHVENFGAVGKVGETGEIQETSLAWQKVAKNHWLVETPGQIPVITISYTVFANELTVRTNHLDASHGYFNGAAMFFYIPDRTPNNQLVNQPRKQPIQISIVSPEPDWIVTTPLKPLADQAFTYIAEDFDTLVDSPFEIGTHSLYEFTTHGIPHTLAIWGSGNAEPEKIIADTQKIIEVESQIFGGLPYDYYVFILHLTANSFGGLEHKKASCLIYPRFGFRSPEKYQRFMQLVAHEFFHLWNVKRIRPQALEVFDYEQENYTSSLWFSEGTTSYYDLVIPLRAGIYEPKTFLDNLSKEITRLQTTPGRLIQSATASSFDAWIKLYRRDAHSDNSQVSYYLKGELISLLLDLLIRLRHNHQRSLDNVLRLLWQRFGQPESGFSPQELKETIEEVAGLDLTDFWQRYIDGVEELPFGEYLAHFGLQLVANSDPALPFLGMKVQTEDNRDLIKSVEVGSPAQIAGIDPGDELLAIDGIRVRAEQLKDRLKDYQAGDIIKISLFHGDLLRTILLTLDSPRPDRYQLLPVDNPQAIQAENFQRWLGSSLESIK